MYHVVRKVSLTCFTGTPVSFLAHKQQIHCLASGTSHFTFMPESIYVSGTVQHKIRCVVMVISYIVISIRTHLLLQVHCGIA